MSVRNLLLFLILTSYCKLTLAQNSKLQLIDTIVIQSSKLPTKIIDQVYAVSTINVGEISSANQQVSLNEVINIVPGVFAMNNNNYAQGLRISIRGFGSRAAFGIRGIKLIVDGIPETTPDGQGQLDNLDLLTINRVEIIRGASALNYGNASGGVIQFLTDTNFDKNYIKAGLTFGSFGMQQYHFNSGLVVGNSKYSITGTHTNLGGYRIHNRYTSYKVNFKSTHTINKKSSINFIANYLTTPHSEDPGAVNLADATNQRTSARPQNITYDAGESISHLKLGSNYLLQINKKNALSINGYYTNRQYDGRLPFETNGWSSLSRQYLGQGTKYTITKSSIDAVVFGYEWAYQSDIRKRYDNQLGLKGQQTLDQVESFNSVGLYTTFMHSWGNWIINGGTRFDVNQLANTDKWMIDGDQSGQINLNKWSSSIGGNYSIKPTLRAYANISTSYETPSLNELSNNPINIGGFNLNLEPQESTNIEMGIRGVLADNISIDLAAFYCNTSSEIVPYELSQFPGKSFYRNAGTSRRLGIESSILWQICPTLSVKTGYTGGQYIYKSYLIDNISLEGNSLPGLPNHHGSIALTYQQPIGLMISGNFNFSGSMYAEDGNLTTIKPYQIANIKASYELKKGKLNFIPFLGVNNLFNTKYFDNIRINAFGNRYYETAAPTNIYAGIRFSY